MNLEAFLLNIENGGRISPFNLSNFGIIKIGEAILILMLSLFILFIIDRFLKKTIKTGLFSIMNRIMEPAYRITELLFPAGKYIPTGDDEKIDLWLKDKSSGSQNSLIQGDKLGWIKSKIPENSVYGYIYQEVPEHIRKHIVVDGRLPGGWDVNWLAWRHVSAEVVGKISAEAIKRSRIKARNLFLISSLIGSIFTVLIHSSSVVYPEWASGISTIPFLQYYSLNVASLSISLSITLIIAFIASSMLIPVFAFLGFWKVFNIWWNKQNENISIPTRDTIFLWKNNQPIRDTYLKSYRRSIDILNNK